MPEESLVNLIVPRFLTALFAATPVIELRGAIPFAYKIFKLSLADAFLWSVVGNSLVGVLVFYLMKPIETICVRYFPRCNILVQRYFVKAREKFAGTHAKYGALGLAVFVAIPLPMTGAWTGAVAAHVLGLPRRMSILSLTLGVVAAGMIVTLATAGIIKIF